MKTYEETTNMILEKSEKIIKHNSQRKKMAISLFSMFCAIIAVVVLCSINSKNSSYEHADDNLKLVDEKISPTSTTDNLDTKDSNENDTAKVNDVTEANNNYVINSNDNININKLSEQPIGAYYALVEDLFVEMTRSQLLEHYNVPELDLSKILDGFNEVNNERYGIYYFGDGSECSSHVFTWENESSSQSINIELANNNIPLSAPFRLKDNGNWGNATDMVSSEIAGTDIMLCSYLDDIGNVCFHAEFMIGKTGYSLYSQNLNENDFLVTLVYLITSK